MSSANSGRGLDRDLVCLDLETTGGHPSRNRIIEIGLIEIDRDGSERVWGTLVHPGVRIPSQIEDFTGISNEMVADAPSFEDVHRELLERLSGRLFVAHNARFDYGFVRAELLRLGLRFVSPVLCTVKLSRRIYPEHPRHNLDSVMARHGLSCAARHRALGDATVLRDLLAIWRREVAEDRLVALVDGLLTETSLPPQLGADLADELPEAPGVYRFYGEEGALLYVGKSKNIRKRVLEHFAAEHRSVSEAKLARLVQRVEWTETAGELGALLSEARAVKQTKPLHNRRLRNAHAVTLHFVPGSQGLDRLDVVAIEQSTVISEGDYFGLYKDAKTALRAAEEICRAHRLCPKALGLDAGRGVSDEGASCFAYQLGRCKGACLGHEAPGLHNVRARVAFASSRIVPWPFRGRVAVVESDWRGCQDFHVIEGWRYLGTVRDEMDARELIPVDSADFDPDIYRILRRFFDDPGQARVVELV
ncbi:MAG: exonuclease domain-containing protein [Pseudomonadota bacterium]